MASGRNRNTRAQKTQALVNAYPLDSDIRNLEQSIGGQLLNSVGNKLDDLYQQLRNTLDGYHITTANLDDIDLVYRFSLPGTFEFTQRNNDPDNPVFKTPVTSGHDDQGWHNIAIASGNDIESFWYDVCPSRLTLSGFDITVTGEVFDDTGNEIYTGIVSGVATDTPFILGAGSGIDFDMPTQVWIEMVSGQNFLDTSTSEFVRRGIVTVAGINRQGLEDIEHIVFLHKDIKRTNKTWKNIRSIDISDVTPRDEAKVRVLVNRFERIHEPPLPAPIDFYNLSESTVNHQQMDHFWDIAENESSNKVLELKTWVAQDLRDRIGNFLDKEAVRSWQLLDTSENVITNPIDLTVVPFTNFIWVIDSQNKAYLFDNEWDMPDMNLLTGSNNSAMAQIIPDRYHVSLGDPVSLNYSWRRPLTEIQRHRVSAFAPDGTKYSIINGSFTAFDPPNAWAFGKITGRNLRRADDFTLGQRGDWVFKLDTVFVDGRTETHKIIISVDFKKALAEFSLDIDPTENIVGIDVGSDQNLWFLAVDDNNVPRKYRAKLFYDVMLVDFDKKVMYFRDEYDQVRVNNE